MQQDHYTLSNGRLKRKDNTVYFVREDGSKQSLPIERIRNIHIYGEVDFNSKLLNYLSQYDICIHIYNYYGYYSGTYYPRKKNV
ncbi:MAG: subtype I-B CRISPR-associated endonuclease Cas1, partial [Firmicutes bacterium]|nr:subtype I-B CRISPR-associated endonuclease Cas1 [Bacillota bacterium]